MKKISKLIFTLPILVVCSCTQDMEKELLYKASNMEEAELEGIIGHISFNEVDSSFTLKVNKSYDLDFYHALDKDEFEFELISNQELDYSTYINKNVWVDGEVISGNLNNQNDNLARFRLKGSNIFEYEIFDASRKDSEEEYICRTPAPAPPSWVYDQNSTMSRSIDDQNWYSKRYNVRYFVHIIRPTSKFCPIPTNDILNLISSRLSSFYSAFNITFSVVGFDYIDSDAYFNLTDSNVEQVFKKNSHTNYVDIYTTYTNTLKNTGGLAESIPSSAFIFNLNCKSPEVISHEMGHCLGLYHTHHGTCIAESGTPELVDGSNSTIAGDFISDTPADPYIWNSDGTYGGGNLTDANGDVYHPDPTNVMSYSHVATRFTTGQVFYVNRVLEDFNEIVKATTKTELEINGNDIITSNTGTYTVNFTPENSIEWNITRYDFKDRISSPEITYDRYTGSSVIINQGTGVDQRIILEASAPGTIGPNYKVKRTIYVSQPNAKSCTLNWSSESSYGNFGGSIALDNPNSANQITCYPGSTIYLQYIVRSGATSVRFPEFYDFRLVSADNPLKKSSLANHMFTVDNSATTFNGKVAIQVALNNGISGSGQIYYLPLRIIAKPMVFNAMDKETDITESGL